jgi:hypothetical protein
VANEINRASGENLPPGENPRLKTEKNKELEHLPSEAMDLIIEKDFTKLIEPMKDIIMLAGVMSAMATERFWAEPRYAYDTFRVFDILLRGTFYEEEAVHGERELVHRFERVYGAPPTIDIPKLVRLCRKNNWATGVAQPPLRLTIIGKRMIEQLFRLANDALVYHSRPPLLKEIYQAQRDLQLAKAYEDVGIGQHDTIASVLSNLENAISDLRYQREKYVQDRQALEKYQAVMSLLDMLERELGQRLKKLDGIIDLKLEKQYNRSARVFYRLLTELSLLLGDNAYTSQVQLGRRILQIDREKFLKYLVDSFSGQLPGLALSPLEVLSYMEQGVYEDIGTEEINDAENPPGLWLAFTLPFFLHEDDITEGVSIFGEWIERWEQPPEDTSFDTDINYNKAKNVTTKELAGIIGTTSSIADELSTDTRPLVDVIRKNSGKPMHAIIRKAATGWGDAVRNTTIMGFLISEREVATFILDDSGESYSDNLKEKKFNRPWRFKYPDNRVRYVKATPALGRHLERKSIHGRDD